MGNSNSHTNFEELIYKAERDVLSLTKIPEEFIARKNVVLKHGEDNDETICIRTFIFDDESPIEKPTLVMLHGFSTATVLYYPLYAPLLDHYRIIGIDLLGFGASSRVTLPDEMTKDSEAMDEYQVRWVEKWVAKMTEDGLLPEKFLLSGHSYGGYLSSLFAIRNPERVKALFLNSAIGHEKVPDNYDTVQIRMSSDSNEPDSPLKLDFIKSQWERGTTMHDLAKVLPNSGISWVVEKCLEDDFIGYPEKHYEFSRNYIYTIYAHNTGSDNQKAVFASFKYGCYAKNPMTAPDKLGNPDLPFPIAYAFGDRDWVGGEGADQIVKGNKFFSSGLSQIFSLPESDHVTYLHNSDALVDAMIGYFNETVKHTFQPQPRTLYPAKRICSHSQQFYLPEEPDLELVKNKMQSSETNQFSLITQANGSLLADDDILARHDNENKRDYYSWSFFSQETDGPSNSSK